MKLSKLALIPVVASALAAAAQTSSPVRVDDRERVELHGSVSMLAKPQFDRGAVEDDFPVQRALVMLQPSPEREAGLQRFLREAHTPDSAGYHKWLTPEQYGERFGATDDDIAVVTKWLQASGFSVARVTKSKGMIEFSGTAAQVRSALHTEIHRYQAGGKSLYANDREMTVPAAIAARIKNVAPLSSVAPTSYVRVAGRGTFSRETHRVVAMMRADATQAGADPKFTTTADDAPFYALAPEDFATQYDLGPVYSAGTKGDGQTIGVIGTANLNLALVDAYRKLFNLPADHTNVIVDGEDPGDGSSPDVEGFLDVEASGSVAPDATVNYYVAGGQPLQNSLALAALRAIDDNEASVLSVSYGQCEQILGPSGNQLWYGLWQQAAAQGQTVLVASGDSGPTTCPDVGVISSGVETITDLGPSVSGITSTPWNVSVGGTDFYYSDYATGGTSIATLWNATNDGSLGSLKAPLPEQPWDGAFGLNLEGDDLFMPYGAAGGGGSSNCTQSTPVSGFPFGSCTAGYAKPSWQQAPGVPADGARDVPDVSLFASNGLNRSAWPICATAGQCSGTSPEVFLVGGTSASTPAMAGIMAMVNQKYGRQGQANYTLYALAQQQASSFHDVAIGTNDVLCFPGSPECVGGDSSPTSGTTSTSDGRYYVYAAAAGYDQATGLGSIDASLLLTNWGKITTTDTTTSLQVSSATIAHGSPLAVTASVKPASGSGTPSGDVTLETSPATSLREGGLFTLSGGTASGEIAKLPGGTYSLVAQYSGDGVFGASTSSPVSVTITPEASTAPLTLEEGVLFQENFTVAGGVAGGSILNATRYTPILNRGQGAFGGRFVFQVTPAGQSSGSSGLATGTATFTDGSTTATVPVGVNGIAAWIPQTLALGAHSVTVAYSGDASYAASTSAPLSFTVVQGTPVISAGFETQELFTCPPTTTSSVCSGFYPAGSSPLIHILMRTPYANVVPTGTVTATLGSVTQTAPLTAVTYLNVADAVADLTLPNVPAGSYTLTVTYSGDTNWSAASFAGAQPVVFAAANSASTTTTLSVGSSTAATADVVTFNYTVTASSAQYGYAPTGFVVLLANGSTVATGFAGSGVIAPGVTESGSIQVAASNIPAGTEQIVAYYAGTTGFAPSTSAPVSLNVSDSEFTLASGTTSIGVAAGKTATAPLMLGTTYGLTVPVALTCAPSVGTFTCAINPPSTSVSGHETATLTINAYITLAPVAGMTHPAERHSYAVVQGIVAFACVVMLGLPGRRRRRWPMQGLLALMIGVCLIGCGGSGSSTPVNPPPPINSTSDTPAGTYSVTVQGVSGGITHNVKIDVTVQ